MTERALSGRRIIVLGEMGSLGKSVMARLRADASMVAADVKLPADEDRHDDVEYVIAAALGEASVSETLVKWPPSTAVANLIGGCRPPQARSGLEFAAVLAFLVSDDAALISGAAIPVYSRT